MENDTNKDFGQEDQTPKQENKKYPGYKPDSKSGNTRDEFLNTESMKDSDSLLAEKGPIRNSNYHNMDYENTIEGKYKKNRIMQGSDAKTLEDFNKTDPKRDINKGGLENKI